MCRWAMFSLVQSVDRLRSLSLELDPKAMIGRVAPLLLADRLDSSDLMESPPWKLVTSKMGALFDKVISDSENLPEGGLRVGVLRICKASGPVYSGFNGVRRSSWLFEFLIGGLGFTGRVGLLKSGSSCNEAL